jgi:hypothetical protein
MSNGMMWVSNGRYAAPRWKVLFHAPTALPPHLKKYTRMRYPKAILEEPDLLDVGPGKLPCD